MFAIFMKMKDVNSHVYINEKIKTKKTPKKQTKKQTKKPSKYFKVIFNNYSWYNWNLELLLTVKF